MKEARADVVKGTNLQVRLEDMFRTSGDQLADSYSLRIWEKTGNIRMTRMYIMRGIWFSFFRGCDSHRSAPAVLWPASYLQTPGQFPDSGR